MVTELSRIDRSLKEIMSILHNCMERRIEIFTTRESYKLRNDIRPMAKIEYRECWAGPAVEPPETAGFGIPALPSALIQKS